MTTIWFKHSVRVYDVSPVVLQMTLACQAVVAAFGYPRIVVTSVSDSRHSERSLHYRGLAVDVRSKEFGEDDKDRILAGFRQALGDDYDILLEDRGRPNEHYHLEYDPE